MMDEPSPYPSPVFGNVTTFDRCNPMTVAAIAIIKPTRGPEAPISSNAFLCMPVDLVFIIAPNVPGVINGGAGIK